MCVVSLRLKQNKTGGPAEIFRARLQSFPISNRWLFLRWWPGGVGKIRIFFLKRLAQENCEANLRFFENNF